MSCWGVRNLILDTNTKEIQIQLAANPASELHITSHWYDHYKNVQEYGNRHGFSTWDTAATIVPAPSSNNCWKREVTAITVYNPNNALYLFYIIEYDDSTWIATVIDEKLLNPFESWTTDCICNCGGSCGINIYDDGEFIYGNASNIDFIGECLITEYNNVTWRVDVTFLPSIVWTWCEWLDPYKLTICWVEVDLSCLASGGSMEIPVELATFIMENGDDTTWELHRFDKPYRTLKAAINAWAVNIVMYPGTYNETSRIILSSEFGTDNVSIFAHPRTRFTWSFEIRWDNIKLKIRWDMDWIMTTMWHPKPDPYIFVDAAGSTLDEMDWYNIDIEVNSIDLSMSSLYKETAHAKKYLTFSFVSKKSYLEEAWYYDAKIIIANSTELFATRNYNVSLGYLNVLMSTFDTVSMYQPLVWLYDVWEFNKFRLYNTYLQESIKTVNGPISFPFGGDVYNKWGKLKNIAHNWAKVIIDNVKIQWAFTASGDYWAMFTLTVDNDVDITTTVFKNTIIGIDKSRDAGMNYSIVNAIKNVNVGLNYVMFEWVNTWVLPAWQSEFATSLWQDAVNAPILYQSCTGFLVTNLFFDLASVNISHHGHGRDGDFDNKHIIYTGREPYTYLNMPPIDTNYSL